MVNKCPHFPGLRGSTGHGTLNAKPRIVLGQSETAGHPHVRVRLYVSVYTCMCSYMHMYVYKCINVEVSLSSLFVK